MFTTNAVLQSSYPRILWNRDLDTRIRESNNEHLKSAGLNAKIILDNRERIISYLQNFERNGENTGPLADELHKIDRIGTDARNELLSILQNYDRDVGEVGSITRSLTPTAVPKDAPPITPHQGVRPRALSDEERSRISSLSKGNPLVPDSNILSRVIEGVLRKSPGLSVSDIYERVTGEKVDPSSLSDPNRVKKFHDALVVKLTLIQNLVGNHPGSIEAVFNGDISSYLNRQNRESRFTRNDPETLLSPSTENLLSGLASLGIGVLSKGVITFAHEREKVNAEKFIKAYEEYQKKNSFQKWWSSFTEAFFGALTGKRLAFQFLKNESEGNVQKYLDDIWKYIDAVYNPENPENKKIQSLARKYGYNQFVSNQDRYRDFQKALIETYIQTEGYKRKGTDYSISLGIFFAGGRIGRIRSGEPTKTVELVTTRETVLDKSVLQDFSITYDTTKNQWKHTFPQSLTVDGKTIHISPPNPGNSLEGNKYVLYFDEVQDMKIEQGDGDTYSITFSKRENQPSKPKEEITRHSIPQGEQQARSLRESASKKDIAEKLLFIGHPPQQDRELFRPLIIALSRQDSDGIRTALSNLKNTKYRTLANTLEKDINDANTWTTYMYLSRKSRNAESVNSKMYNNERTQSLLNAENRLAKNLGITSNTDEASFSPQEQESVSPVQATTFAPGREMSSMVFATPRTGTHRADTMDGSIAILGKHVPLTGSYREQVVDAFNTSIVNGRGIDAQVRKLNAFLSNQGISPVTREEYVTYLKNGDIGALGVPGLRVQTGKEPMIFEGRAMISGNVCLNRSYHIAYPVFSIEKENRQIVHQTVESSARIIDRNISVTPGALGNVETGEAAIGVNPVGVILLRKPGVMRPSKSTPTNGNSTSTPIHGRAPGNNSNIPAGSTGRVSTTTSSISAVSNERGIFNVGIPLSLSSYLSSGSKEENMESSNKEENIEPSSSQ